MLFHHICPPSSFKFDGRSLRFLEILTIYRHSPSFPFGLLGYFIRLSNPELFARNVIRGGYIISALISTSKNQIRIVHNG